MHIGAGRMPNSHSTENASQDHPLGITDIEFRAELIYFIVIDRFYDGEIGRAHV